MSPEHRASKLDDIADQLDRVRCMIDAAELASEALNDEKVSKALSVLLDEIATKVAMQAWP